MNPPKNLFGFPAHWMPEVSHQETGFFRIMEYGIHALRWELSDVRIEGLDLDSGHVVTYAVEAPGQSHHLIQDSSSFYQQEGTPRLTCPNKEIDQGDGVSAPQWHKCDRHWPEENGQAYEFVGQGYFINKVAYLFRHPNASRIAIFTDQIDRQDAEEHYATEEEEGSTSRRRQSREAGTSQDA